MVVTHVVTLFIFWPVEQLCVTNERSVDWNPLSSTNHYRSTWRLEVRVLGGGQGGWKYIQQSTPWTNGNNKLIVTLTVKHNLGSGSTVTITGLTGSQTSDISSPRGWNPKWRWQSWSFGMWPICECRWDERLKTKAEKSTRLTYTGLLRELEHLKIKTRLIDEMFASVMG